MRSRLTSQEGQTKRLIFGVCAILAIILVIVMQSSASDDTSSSSSNTHNNKQNDAKVRQHSSGSPPTGGGTGNTDLPPALDVADALKPGWCRISEDKEAKTTGSELERIRTECPQPRTVTCNGKPKGKALVVYMMSNTKDENLPDLENFNQFLSLGIVRHGESTQLYEGVDYVFTKLSTDVSKVTECSSAGNIWLMFVPPGPCDLCAHARVLDHFGIKADGTQYRQIFFLNAGVRGPFQAKGSAHWIDVMSFNGRSELPNTFGIPVPRPLAAGVTSISWERKAHPQSFFISLHMEMLHQIQPLFMATCDGGKQNCIDEGEMLIGDRLWAADHVFFSYYQNFTFTRKDDSDEMNKKYGVGGPFPNPTRFWMDPCRTVFSKFGGEVWRQRVIPESMMTQVQSLTDGLRLTKKTYYAMKDMPMPGCKWM